VVTVQPVPLYSGATLLAYNKKPRLIDAINVMIDSGKFGNKKSKGKKLGKVCEWVCTYVPIYVGSKN
jgi:hypothetical protein